MPKIVRLEILVQACFIWKVILYFTDLDVNPIVTHRNVAGRRPDGDVVAVYLKPSNRHTANDSYLVKSAFHCSVSAWF
jgi:hypothetical protein